MNSSKQQYDVAIVGAGFAGLYLLYRFQKIGLTARIWEKAGDVGGVWYWNRYPGARCDVESMQYSYQFDEELQQEWCWSERYSPQPEILRYAQHVAKRFNLLEHIDFDHTVEKVQFDEPASVWKLTASSGDTLTARFCVMATGCLSVPNWPPMEGYDNFNGELYHTALWPHDGVDFHNKKVAVIGTGSSAIQSIPEIAADAESLTVFQRTPNYVVPAHNAPLEDDAVARVKANYAELRASAGEKLNGIHGHYSDRSAMSDSHEERLAEYERRWQTGGLTFVGAYGDLLKNQESNDSLREFIGDKIRSIVNDANTADALTPKTFFGGKRVCVDTNYYETYNRSNVRLIDLNSHPIEKLTKGCVVTKDSEFDVDIIVIATGFDAITGALNQVDIQGKSGISLQSRWRDGPSSYLGLALANFPNLFTVTGPGSPSVLTNMLPTIEHHVEWITDCISYMEQNNYSVVEASEDAETKWWQHCQDVAGVGLRNKTKSWYNGSNIEGKAGDFLPYNAGFPMYKSKVREVTENGYDGFVFL